MTLARIDADSRLYVIAEGRGYSCLGFDNAERRRRAVLEWMARPVPPADLGTPEHWAEYEAAMQAGAEHAARTGQRCPAALTPRLVGLEGRRVEVLEPDGTTRRFTVGRSTGWMPCHLEIASKRSHGGPAAYLPEGSAVRVVR